MLDSGFLTDMNNMAEGHDRTSLPASSSPQMSHHSTSKHSWVSEESPLMSPGKSVQTEPNENHCIGSQSNERPSPHFYEDLFCINPNSLSLVPLAGALVTSLGPQSDVVRQGYLGKLERKHRRYFVLRAGSHTGLSRLEWYQKQEKFTAMEKSTGKAGLFGASKQGVIYLRCCLGVSRVGSPRKGHTVVLYDRDQTMVLVMDDQQEQEDWYVAIKRVMEEEQMGEERADEEDDGYCTLPPAAYFKEVGPDFIVFMSCIVYINLKQSFTHQNLTLPCRIYKTKSSYIVEYTNLRRLPLVGCYISLPFFWPLPPSSKVWPVTVKPRGLGSSKSLTGENRLCLTGTSLILVRMGAGKDLPSVMIPLLSVRRFGHLDGLFYLELGRSAPNGPGEIWMEVRNQGNPALAQHIHEVVREMLRTVRALPDFSRSPASCLTQPQAFLTSKRCRPKYRDKLGNVRPLAPLMLFPRTPDTQMSTVQSYSKPCSPDRTKPDFSWSSTSHRSSSRTQQSSMTEDENYLDMDRVSDSAAACRMQEQELTEEEEGSYLMMSPRVMHSPSVVSQDDFMAMVSPEKQAYSSSPPFLQASFSSSTSDSSSPLCLSHHQSNEQLWLITSVQQSEIEAGQSQRSISCIAQPRQEQNPAQHTQHSTPPAAGDMMPPFASRPLQSIPHLDTGQSSQCQAVPSPPSARRHLLSFCLPSCIRAQDRS
ncbi:insulin receptor substrate 1-B-like isoform X2 [Parambassis ranga]|uniref:Insulin receptor substrate 1-B-like isoform X2 n=1 Tax=Parambassis ranga TaxID=210632 RepID=A0A6P7HQE5_9TELE|nr:insulin receptor substrate 1-B-like isoform X2 [Parambassis ranga]